MHDDRWQGSLWLAPDFAILHGAAGATDSHAHYAHQLMLSTGAPFTAELDGIVHTARHLLIESLRPHAIVAEAAHLSRTMRSLFGVRADRSLRQLQVTLLD